MTQKATMMDVDATDAPPAAAAPAIIKHRRPQVVGSHESVQMPWVEKYRPASLEDLVAHEDIVAILTRLIDSDNLPHLLLYGPPGTGKVSMT
jgi:replication factor C subunit 3/5